MEQKRLILPSKPKPLKSLGAGEGNWRDEWPKGGRFRKHPLLAALVFIPVFVLRAAGRTKSEPHEEGPRESLPAAPSWTKLTALHGSSGTQGA